MIVEVIKTNVQTEIDTNYIIDTIHRQFPEYHINFDLEDCDKILRVEALELNPKNIIQYVNNLGYICIPLE